ncbi:LLM class flavin-dependent oxidoreductase [Rathayibacter tritici]|uniref:LLM class flavin-dependent oxidoreductase n=1 Tax=Rathayibacter tritici TaxID=33888 RepID=UPI0011B08769|nr:LLM class flavin-dependent oxidoreductase [Rathayibacter tritici]
MNHPQLVKDVQHKVMKFGVSFLPDVNPGLRSPVQYYRDLIRLSLQAEMLGFESVIHKV